MLMVGIVLILAAALRDILKYFDERFMRPHLNHPDKEYVSKIYKERSRISLFQVIASILFTVPFIILQDKFLGKFHPEEATSYYLRMLILTSIFFTIGSLFTALFFRVLYSRY